MSSKQHIETDIVLIGAGIMSATLGLLLKELNPAYHIEILERLDAAATESSEAWNNAGTGHAAFCELNYTPEKNGKIDIAKALNICEQFEESRQFWSYLVNKNIIDNPRSFVNNVPHLSFVWGENNVKFLKNRFEALKKAPLFEEMEYTEDSETIKTWAPLLMRSRKNDVPVAATKMNRGTDVNYGELTRKMIAYQTKQDAVNVSFKSEVYDLKKQADGKWKVLVKDLATGNKRIIISKFVFIGAGGGSILLLEKSGIPEAKGYGGFPVSGQWLVCTNEDLVNQHQAKVYGKASVGTPPMSVPHLDTRYINGKKALLFGPYAGFSTKFLKTGSYFDLIKSLTPSNLVPMIQAGLSNIDLTKYLIGEVLQSDDKRIESLKNYLPDAKKNEWKLEIAGQRVQVIKKKNGKGVLEFGTEVINSADGSLAALLGASPGASTTVSIMINLIKRCFPKQFESAEWQSKFKEMIPSFGKSLNNHPELLKQVRKETSQTLQLGEE